VGYDRSGRIAGVHKQQIAHVVIASVPPLEGPNEERNPPDLMLGAATCGSFLYERVAQETVKYPGNSEFPGYFLSVAICVR
jgi:hypothetical protein